MHGREGEPWKQWRHMWPVPAPSTVAADATPFSTDYFCKDGRKICIGDCALFKPPQDAPPFIGIIRRLTGKEDTLKLGVNWLYRPADVKLGKGILLESAPNEVFYSFHKDEIPAASLLHPCKVAFLCEGVELPPGISSFVCRRVYDIENRCLWWLTDQDYIDERQGEVDKLLDKTRTEMHGALQSGGRSPKSLISPTSTPPLKSGLDSGQNSISTSSFSSQVKQKKRERGGDLGSDFVKRERLSKTEDGDSGQPLEPESMLRSDIAKLTGKGALTDLEGVDKLIQLMQPENAEKKIDVTGRIMLANVIAITDRYDCLGRFTLLGGLPVLNEWLQDVHKGRIGPNQNDKSVEELLLSILRALEKLPVNLQALQTCNVGKSVNHLRSHKNTEIQKKARSLVDTWKKRVDAEMKTHDTPKSDPSRTVSSPGSSKPVVPSEASQVGNRRNEVGTKSSTGQPSLSKMPPSKVGSGSTKSSVSTNSNKDPNNKVVVGGGNSDQPLATIKEEKSSSSSQSQSCSSDHNAKTAASSFKEDARSTSRHRSKSINGPQKESSVGKPSSSNKNLSSEKTSPASERVPESPLIDHGNSQRLIVRLPNMGRSPVRTSSGGSFEDANASSEQHPHHDRKVKGKNDSIRYNIIVSNVKPDGKDGLVGSDEDVKPTEAPKATITHNPGKSIEASFSPMNALIESCAKFSEAGTSTSAGDHMGMNLLASVAAGEMCKSDFASRLDSPRPHSPVHDNDSCSDNDAKSRSLLDEDNAQSHGQPNNWANICDSIIDHSRVKDELQNNGETLCVHSDVKPSELTCAASLPPKEGNTEGQVAANSNCFSDSKANITNPLSDEKSVNREEAVAEAPATIAEVPMEATEEPPSCSSLDVAGDEGKSVVMEHNLPPPVEKKCSVAMEGKNENTLVRADCGNDLATRSKSEKAADMETENHLLQSASDNSDSESAKEKSAPPKVSSLGPVRETQKSKDLELDGSESDKMGEPQASRVVEAASISNAGLDMAVKLNFDLNEGFPGEDSQLPECSSSTPVPLPCPALPFPVSATTATFPASITVAAAAKGPFVPPDNPLRIKGELGWKGSAATSAFRPAEPRKILEMPLCATEKDSMSSRQARILDFDLNVPDERLLDDDTASKSRPRDGSSGGLDLDLNKADESMETPSLLARSSLSGRLPNGEFNVSRNFDLNNGPGLDEVSGEPPITRSQLAKSNLSFLSPVAGVRTNGNDIGNFSSWTSAGNPYSAMTIPSILPPSATGSQRLFCSPTEIYRGPVLSSSPAISFPANTPFHYHGFPFETSFPLSSNSFPGCQTTHMESSSGGAICFPTIPSQLVGTAGVVSQHYPRPPYVMNINGGITSNGGPESRKWGNPGGFDLNSGPDERLPSALRQLSVGGSQALAEDQLKMYQVPGGGVSKRKEPDGGWDGADRFSYKGPWQ